MFLSSVFVTGAHRGSAVNVADRRSLFGAAAGLCRDAVDLLARRQVRTFQRRQHPRNGNAEWSEGRCSRTARHQRLQPSIPTVGGPTCERRPFRRNAAGVGIYWPADFGRFAYD